jgi:hypothetical protein
MWPRVLPEDELLQNFDEELAHLFPEVSMLLHRQLHFRRNIETIIFRQDVFAIFCRTYSRRIRFEVISQAFLAADVAARQGDRIRHGLLADDALL